MFPALAVGNTVGAFFAAGFGAMSEVVMLRLIFYQYASMLRHAAELECSMSLRLATGFSLGARTRAFFAVCAFAAWRMPACSLQACQLTPHKPGLAQQVLRRLLDALRADNQGVKGWPTTLTNK